MKICFLVHDINPKNGGGRFAHDLIYGVKNAGHEVVILKEEDDGFEGMPVLSRGFRLLNSALKIRRYIKNCDIIHALDGYPYGVIGALANISVKKRLVISGIGSYSISPLYNWRTSWLLKWAYKKADQIIAISNFTKTEISKKLKFKNIIVINPGIDFEKFHRSRTKTDENFILSVGAVKKRKGYHISIPAFALVKKQIPEFKYKIVGGKSDAAYLNYLKGIIRKSNIENSVEFLGEVSEEELKELYGKAKLFILTSVNVNYYFEGFGLVFLEAAAAGLPVIGTHDNGIEDALKNGYNGLLVPQDDIGTTSRAVIDLINNKDKWQEFSQNAYFWAREHNLDKTVFDYLDIYIK